jgi:hypothetical protein
MENFFTYISKPVDKEDLQLWIDGNNICYNKFDLFNDFVSSLVNLIYDTYLGNDENKTTNIRLDNEDNEKHFDWCWSKVIDNFAKEEIYFENKGEHYEFFKGFIIETFYNQQLKEVRFSLSRFFDEIFNLDGVHTMSDLDLLKQIYRSLDKNLENNNLLN